MAHRLSSQHEYEISCCRQNYLRKQFLVGPIHIQQKSYSEKYTTRVPIVASFPTAVKLENRPTPATITTSHSR